jgi:hypothetical protein
MTSWARTTACCRCRRPAFPAATWRSSPSTPTPHRRRSLAGSTSTVPTSRVAPGCCTWWRATRTWRRRGQPCVHWTWTPAPDRGVARDSGRRLRWEITVTGDGRLRLGGALPTLIHWQGAHPTEGMPAAGLALQRLELRGWPAPLQAVLALAGVELAPARAGRARWPLGVPADTRRDGVAARVRARGCGMMAAMTTEELFREDSALLHCEATVLALEPEGIVLDRTVFYPLGGRPGR